MQIAKELRYKLINKNITFVEFEKVKKKNIK